MTDSLSVECDECELQRSCPLRIDSEKEPMNGITKATFSAMGTDAKLDVLFDYISNLTANQGRRVQDRNNKCHKQKEECETKFTDIAATIKSNRILNTSAAALGGSIGGAVTLLSYIKWFA